MREFRPGSFQILPPIIKNLLIINALVFAAQYTVEQSGHQDLLNDLLALHTWQSPLFEPWQFVTHMFMHGNLGHIFSNMFALWMFGSVLENLWGPKKFLTFYLVCGLGAALIHMIALYVETNSLLEGYNALTRHFNFGNFQIFYKKHNVGSYYTAANEIFHAWKINPDDPVAAQQAYMLSKTYVNAQINEPTLGASGAVFGCLAAFGYLFPNTYIYLYFLLPLKAKWFVIIYAGFELVMALENSAGDNVAHFAHLGGAVFGLALVYFWNKTNRRTFY